MRFGPLLLTGFLLVGLAGGAGADTVILKSGARVRGEVSVSGGMVRVSNHDGTHHLRAGRVARVIRSRGRFSSANPGSHDPKRSVRGGSHRVAYRSGNSAAIRAIRRRISVDFDDTRRSAVVEYLGEITEANFSYDPSVLDAHPPVTMHLRDVSVGRVLNLLVEGRDLSWGVKDNIIRIREGSVSALHVRVYDVRDLLLNVEDKRAPRVRTVGDSTSDDDDDDGFGSAAGWGDDDGDDWGFDSEDDDDDGGRGEPTPSQSLRGRARDLARLITSTVRPNSWADPAVVVIGGVRQDESEENLDLW